MPSEFRNIKRTCLMCRAPLILRNSRDIERKKYCSRTCAFRHYAVLYPDNAKRLATLGQMPEVRKKAGATCSNRMRLGLIPKPPIPSPEIRKANGLRMRGANHPHWIADRSKLKKPRHNCSDREVSKMQRWREAVFSRDNYTCQRCFVRGGRLQAHHILPYAKYEALRYEIGNGLALCVACHKAVHSRKKEPYNATTCA